MKKVCAKEFQSFRVTADEIRSYFCETFTKVT